MTVPWWAWYSTGAMYAVAVMVQRIQTEPGRWQELVRSGEPVLSERATLLVVFVFSVAVWPLVVAAQIRKWLRRTSK